MAARRAPPLAVLVHHEREARAALALAVEQDRPIELCAPAGLAGPAFVRALEEVLEQPVTAVCDDRAGLVMAALRAGLRRLVFSGPERLRLKLAELAAMHGAEVLAAPAGRLVVPGPGGTWIAPATCVSSGPTSPPSTEGPAS